MKRQNRWTLLFALIVQLLLGQQMALAHMIGHLGDTHHVPTEALAATAYDEDEEHGVADSLLHICTTCVAFVGLDAVLARNAALAPATSAKVKRQDWVLLPAPAAYRFSPFHSRAPPSFPS